VEFTHSDKHQRRTIVDVSDKTVTAVSVAALSVYDPCKAVSKDNVIEFIQLVEQTGGSRDFKQSVP
jgi:cyclic pyranopterin monophosphate synthase